MSQKHGKWSGGGSAPPHPPVVPGPRLRRRIWESRKDVHTWALLSGGVDKAQNWRKYAS